MPFQKGQSGNPGGRPKGQAELIELARSYTVENVRRIANLAANSESEKIKLAASIALHEIGWGKPAQSVKADVTHEAGDTLTELMLRLRNGSK